MKMKTEIQSTSSYRKSLSGFTLVEMLLVIGIIAVLLGAVLMRTKGFTDTARITATEQRIGTVISALRAYEANNGFVPSKDQGLRALVEKPGGRPEPRRWIKLLDEDQLLDAWRNEFAYMVPARKGGEDFEVVSMGPDGKLGSEDDISSSDAR